MILWYVDLMNRVSAIMRFICLYVIIVLFQTGFKLEENITVHGISFEALRITCQEAICWGNSFRSLSHLVTPDPQTGKLQQNGLIFKVHTILSRYDVCPFIFLNYI